LTFPPPPPPVGTRWNPLGPVLTRCNPLGPVVTRLEFWSCVLTTFLWGSRLHNREKKDWEREREKENTSPAAHHREREREVFVWERKIFKFLLCHNEWMNERTSFCSFCSCGLRETSMMVDYTQILKRKDWEKKGKCMFSITCGPPQREREEIFLEK
jgi:hypothetical protein